MTSIPARQPRARVRLSAALVVVTAGVTGLAGSAPSASAEVAEPPPGMRLVFSDDFAGPAGTGLDRATWRYDLGHGYPGGAPNWGTGEVESMTDSTATVSHDGEGHLAITPLRDAAGNWTSGRVETQRTDFAAPPGGTLRIEASLRLPNVSGAEAAGYWPAFWALGEAARPVGATNWPGVGEWDIVENANGRDTVLVTLHCGVAPGGPCNEFTGIGSGEKPCPDCRSRFHTYAVEYDRGVAPEQLRWYLDGALLHTVKADQVDETTWNNATHHGMFIILNVAIGGAFPAAFGGGPTPATKPGVPMLVDYVAVYQSDADQAVPEPGLSSAR